MYMRAGDTKTMHKTEVTQSFLKSYQLFTRAFLVVTLEQKEAKRLLKNRDFLPFISSISKGV